MSTDDAPAQLDYASTPPRPKRFRIGIWALSALIAGYASYPVGMALFSLVPTQGPPAVKWPESPALLFAAPVTVPAVLILITIMTFAGGEGVPLWAIPLYWASYVGPLVVSWWALSRLLSKRPAPSGELG
jgi:hypothetical protein